MADVPFTAAREVVREVFERMISDLKLNQSRAGGDGVTVEFDDHGFRVAYGTSEFNLVADLSLRVVPKEPITEVVDPTSTSARAQ